MNHPQDWGEGPMAEITVADFVIKYEEGETIPEILKDRERQFTAPHIRVIFIDRDGKRHIFVGHRVRSPERKW